jgi:DNA repair protein RecN (Recombination protein N)
MKKAQFKVSIEFNSEKDENDEYKFWVNGLNKVEFLISPNAGEPLKPLSKIASGGEMSRIMLAIKTILANVDDIPTLIFDEIDIGISGKAAQKVAEKLSIISGNHQVLCVTHLAQIACMADEHFQIEKQSADNLTKTSVQKINDKQIKNEIARILGGSNISDITLKHAEEILGNAKKFKTNSRS